MHAYRIWVKRFLVSNFLIGFFAGSSVLVATAEPLTTESLISLMEKSSAGESVVEGGVHPGEQMFHSACTQCHDAERSTSKRKSNEAWLATVRRMSDKSGANIPESQIEPIAIYLASLNPVEEQAGLAASITQTAAESSVSLHAEVSLLWRSGEAIQQNNGFFPDVWFGADWNPDGSPFSAQITACTSCHEAGGGGVTLELVEASFTADLVHLLAGEDSSISDMGFKADAKAGRFIVPFGAFSESVHPGSYRMITAPLMFNMGRRVGPEEFMTPVLPMPYADEGIDFHIASPMLPASFVVAADVYAVNGLQSDFYASRGYSDNNDNTALGGRITLGNPWVRIGTSYNSGEMQYTGTPTQNYRIMGADATVRFRDWVRFYYEYAARKEDTLPSQESEVEGHVGEVEVKLWSRPRLALLVRYDTVDHSGLLGDAFTERYTWGPVATLHGGSMFMINHEHWEFDTPDGGEDVVGFRWVAVF